MKMNGITKKESRFLIIAKNVEMLDDVWEKNGVEYYFLWQCYQLEFDNIQIDQEVFNLIGNEDNDHDPKSYKEEKGFLLVTHVNAVIHTIGEHSIPIHKNLEQVSGYIFNNTASETIEFIK